MVVLFYPERRNLAHRKMRRLKWLGRIICSVFGMIVLFQPIYWLQRLEGEMDLWRNHPSLVSPEKLIPDKPIRANDQGSARNETIPVKSNDPKKRAFLVLKSPDVGNHGQGIGNLVSGVLSAHLLAEEFNRTICHAFGSYENSSSLYASLFLSGFHTAFDWKDADHKKTCQKILTTKVDAKQKTTIQTWNFNREQVRQSECAIQELLADHTGHPVVYFVGNTYPRWPLSTHRNLFFETFRPTPALLDILPWDPSDPPHTVVHLREGDSARDRRAGVDKQSLALLAEQGLPNDSSSEKAEGSVFLVTNNVDWYSQFPSWSHPRWSAVRHSTHRGIVWGEKNKKKPSPFQQSDKKKDEKKSNLEMWSDWYTLVNAKRIYHTFSDFSRSAARWNEKIQSWTIDVSRKEKETRLLFLKDGNPKTPRLVDRGPKELLFCKRPLLSARDIAYLKSIGQQP